MEIRDHYNKIKRTRRERRESEVSVIRYTNNFIKACLIHKYVRKDMSVLDLGCGKGGDLLKYNKCGIKEYYGLDIAEVSIYDARLRHNNSSNTFRAYFDTIDCYNTNFDLHKVFDVISSQFSFHYAFQSDLSLSISIKNIDRHLKSNGTFIFTVPNKEEIIKRWKNNKLSNRFYKITYEGGNEYKFLLKGCINDCVEYFVDMDKLKDKLNFYNIRIVQNIPFNLFLEDNLKINREMAQHMKCRKLNKDEWEVVSLYDVMVCKKP